MDYSLLTADDCCEKHTVTFDSFQSHYFGVPKLLSQSFCYAMIVVWFFGVMVRERIDVEVLILPIRVRADCAGR